MATKTDERRRGIVEGYLAGLSPKVLAAKFGCTPSRVWQIVQEEGLPRQQVRHGLCRSPTFKSWAKMKERCLNPRCREYRWYGAKGITVCGRWAARNGFADFLADMGERPTASHSLDRVDPLGNYCPENCRWVERREQARNKTSNHLLTFRGETRCLAEWVEVLGLSWSMVMQRLLLGWSDERALSEPKQPRGKRHRPGLSDTPEYRCWCSMKQRCLNPRARGYAYYGAKGVTICERWRGSFQAFFADMGPRPSPKHELDRIDPSLGYSPDNCRWATAAEQGANKRNVHRVKFQGAEHSLSEWASLVGVPRALIYQRLYVLGWTPERALTTPAPS